VSAGQKVPHSRAGAADGNLVGDRTFRFYVAGGAAAWAAYFLAPGLRGNGLLFDALSLSAALAIVAGVRRHRPEHALAWYCLAAAQLAFVVGDLVYYSFDLPYPNVGDFFYLVFYPLEAAGLVLLVRHRTPGRDRASLIDAGIISLGLGVLSWVFLIGPNAATAEGGMAARLVSIAYPLMDVLLLSVAARLAFGTGARPRAFWFLMAGIVVLLATDAAYTWIELTSGYKQGGLLDSGWIVFYLLTGAAALHPSMRALSARGAPPEGRVSRHRFALLAAATLMAPAVEVVQDIRNGPDHLPVVAIASAVLFLLVLARLSGVVAEAERRRNETLQAELRHQAFHDGLTGLPNRALFLDRLECALDGREGVGARAGVLLVDLDDFGAVNDRLGHAAGDALLAEVARRLRACVGPGDTPARLGSDEFAVLVAGIAEDDEAVAGAERILGAFDEPFVLPEGEVRLSASIGVACTTAGRSPAEAEGVLRNAEVASSTAKGRGKGRCEPFEPLMHRGQTLERLQLRAELRAALAGGEFVVHYQPVARLRSGEIIGVEALVRWAHPVRGLVAPGEFIPVCEESGLIVPIGQYVLEQACRQAARWRRSGPGGTGLTMSINLSAVQLAHPKIVEQVAEAIRAAGVDSARIVLEITESAAVDAGALATLTALKGLGVRLAIDDFGTGYSSLSYLDRLPVDVLKIDRAFTARITEGPQESALARAIVALGPTLGLRTVAEGVETAEQWRLLADLGCDFAQGFLLSRPVDALTLDARLRHPAHNPAGPADGATCAA